MPQKINLLIFDLDGTLIDSKRDIANAVHWTLRDLKLPQISDEEVYAYVGNGVRPLILKSVGEHPEAYKKGLAIFKNYYQEHLLDHTVPFDGVEEVLKYFAAKKKAVFTNKPQYFTDPIIKGLKLDPYFDAVIGSDAGFPKKPDPAAIHHLLKKFDCPPDKAVLVGDSKVDIETGQNAGILTCGVTYGFRPAEEVREAKPDFVVGNLPELVGLFA